MGATEIVDYTDANQLETFFRENAGKFDFVFDAATNSGGGEDYWDKSISLLKRRDDNDKNSIVGKFAALNGPASKWTRSLLGFEKSHESLFFMKSNTADLEQIVSLLNRTKSRPLTNVMTFDEKGLEEAFKLLKSRRTKGKIVFDVSCTASS
jgi:NADPH:quinone reductase-like Zn-dependent oxidoreductase